ncbi:MAG: metal ABC transporter permease [Leptolyngbyaceae cyanobacterium RM2_2_4]|nr:metal ABC transporter permease [Leptolyngbyaceae cyanobacterium RM2_2_4]
MQDFWIVAVVVLLGWSASLLGVFLMLRKMGMLADAIAHSVLPGIVLAYLLTSEKNNIAVLVVASIFGILTALLISWIEKKLNNRGDAATGIVFTFMFAVGVILVTLFAEQADLDAECVLFGEMLYIPFETLFINTYEVPRAFPLALAICAVVFVFVMLGRKYLSFISFDETFSFAIGISVSFGITYSSVWSR